VAGWPSNASVAAGRVADMATIRYLNNLKIWEFENLKMQPIFKLTQFQMENEEAASMLNYYLDRSHTNRLAAENREFTRRNENQSKRNKTSMSCSIERVC
jgi:hypothetical protein